MLDGEPIFGGIGLPCPGGSKRWKSRTWGVQIMNSSSTPGRPICSGRRGPTTTSISAKRNPVAFVADESLIVEEKIDGTNVGIHFSDPR